MRKSIAPASRVVFQNVLTVAIGVAGGLAASQFHIPLSWLLGSMIGTAVYSYFGAVRISKPFRNAMIAVLGVLLGSSFTVDFVDQVGQNSAALAFLVPYTFVATIVVFAMLRRTTSLDTTTAYFSAVPGGVNEMTMIGSARGGNEVALAVHHSLRLIIVIFIVSLVFVIAYGYNRTGPAVGNFNALSASDYAVIAAVAIGGAGLACFARVPAPFILGPMVISAVIHVLGYTDVRPDYGLVAFAQVVSGAAIGTQFNKFSRKDFLSAGVTAVKIAAVLLLITLAFAWLASVAIGRPFPLLLLAFAPGGLGEMGLIALSVGSDAAFVSTGQIFRFFLVVTLATPCHRIFELVLNRYG